MARADLLCDLIQSGLAGESNTFRRAAEAICVEERAKSHETLARKIEDLLNMPDVKPVRKELTFKSITHDHRSDLGVIHRSDLGVIHRRDYSHSQL